MDLESAKTVKSSLVLNIFEDCASKSTEQPAIRGARPFDPNIIYEEDGYEQ